MAVADEPADNVETVPILMFAGNPTTPLLAKIQVNFRFTARFTAPDEIRNDTIVPALILTPEKVAVFSVLPAATVTLPRTDPVDEL